MNQIRHPQSPLLDHCPETLEATAYFDPGWYAQEQRTIWSRNWICAGRRSDFAAGTITRMAVGPASVLVCATEQGAITAYHNVCRHRGAELCKMERAPLSKLITCPYHAWSYAADDGRLASVAYATPTADFDRAAHGLHRVSVFEWAGFVFLNLAQNPRPFAPDMGLSALDNWPMTELVTGHSMIKDLACNWKVFWDNYNECLHCPGIHPELCDMVPIYKSGVMAHNEMPGWKPDTPASQNLKTGAESWTTSGEPCGPVFPNLSDQQRLNGYNFVTIYPTMYIVAHVDYVRAVTLTATGPESMRLKAEWLFPRETLSQPGFDAAGVAAFAKIVMDQDGEAAEMNQRGLRSPAYRAGRLMPQEFDLLRFKSWVLQEMKEEVRP